MQVKEAAHDRRKHRRRPCRSPVCCCSFPNLRDSLWSCVVTDVSEGGLSLLLTRRFEPGTILIIHVRDEPDASPTWYLARVVRVTTLENGRWSVGCQFGLEIDATAMEEIIRAQEAAAAGVPPAHARPQRPTTRGVRIGNRPTSDPDLVPEDTIHHTASDRARAPQRLDNDRSTEDIEVIWPGR